jgi:pectin methylesterase-like acyl-CoA thioesterase
MSSVSVLSRTRRLFGGLAIVGAVLAASVVTATVTSSERVLALPGASESTLVTVDPTRVLDTRFNVGLPGAFQAGVSRKLTVTGSIETYFEPTDTRTTKVVVPAGASGVVLNVTGVVPTGAGWIAVRPGDATGAPSTSNINLVPGDVVPNAVTVAVPTTGVNAGRIDITYGAAAGNTVNVIVDIVGYTTNTGLIDLVNRVTALEASGVGGAGPKGDKGDPGPVGADGAKGDQGDPGVDADSPARVVWVADDGTGDFPLLSAALASITDATASKPYAIKIAPGVYTETSAVALKDHVDVEGSGQDVTTITCACGSGGTGPSATVTAGNITAEIRHLTINNTGSPTTATGVYTADVVGGSFAMRHITITASLDNNYDVYGVENKDSSPTMTNVTVTAVGKPLSGGEIIGMDNTGSSPTMTNVTVKALNTNYGANDTTSTGIKNWTSSLSMNNVTVTATGGDTSYGMTNPSSSTIRNSSITGSTISIANDGASASVKVFDTSLDGPILGAEFACVGASSGGVELGPDCLTAPAPPRDGVDGAKGDPGDPGDKGDQGDPGVDAESPARVVWVADDGTGDFTLLSAALASITDATASKPYLIKIAPGVYTETSVVTMKDHVDVEGSGQGVTELTCACGTAGFPGAAITAGNITAELRQITVTNTGGSTYATGVYTNGVSGGTLSLRNVTATAAGSTNHIGIRNQASSPVMSNIVATATGGASTQGVSNGASSSPSMNNVIATATGGTDNNDGVQNTSSSSPLMNNVIATATGGSISQGVANGSSSPSMNNVTATATGGTNNFGVVNGSSSPTIRNSSITGATNSINNFGTTPSAKVADTVLHGPVAGAGFTCVGVYTAAFAALGATCS